MKRNIVIALLVVFFFGQPLLADEWYETTKTTGIEQISKDIGLLNLINGLYLSAEQVENIIKITKQAEEEHDIFLLNIQKLNREYEENLSVLKGILERNKIIPKENERTITGLKKEIKLQQQKFYQGIKHLETNLEEILTEGQRNIIEAFQPCIIPPRDLSQPTRAGQANSNLVELENFLDLSRKLPKKAYQTFIKNSVNKMLADQELHLGKMNEEDAQAERQRILSIINEARAMSDSDFVVNKTELAGDMVKMYTKISQTYNEFFEFSSSMHGGITKIGTYLLNPRAIPLLEKHLASIKKTLEIKGRNVGSVNPRISNETKKRPLTMNEFAKKLKLNARQARQAWELISIGQQKTWKLFLLPRDDGVTIAKGLQELETSNMHENKKMREFLELLSLDIPGTQVTYFDKMSDIKSAVENNLQKIFSNEQFNKYKVSGIDILNIKK